MQCLRKQRVSLKEDGRLGRDSLVPYQIKSQIISLGLMIIPQSTFPDLATHTSL